MKINIILTRKLALLSAAFCAAMLTFSYSADAVTVTHLGFFPDPLVVGTVTPDDPDDIDAEANYINFMVHLSGGDSGTFQGNTIARSTNVFPVLLTAVNFGFAFRGVGNVIDTAVNVYAYIFAKYQNDVSQVWWIGDVLHFDGDQFVIPLVGPNGGALLHWTVFPGGEVVPDGGTTAMLLGAALGGLGMARRFLKI